MTLFETLRSRLSASRLMRFDLTFKHQGVIYRKAIKAASRDEAMEMAAALLHSLQTTYPQMTLLGLEKA